MNVKDLGHWTDKRKEDEDLDAPISGRKNAGNFGLEIMPSISGRKICRQFWVGNYAGNFWSENMPAILGKKICRRFRVEKKNARNVGKFGPKKKMPVFSGGDKIAGKPAIAGELTGLNDADRLNNLPSSFSPLLVLALTLTAKITTNCIHRPNE